MNRFIKLFWFLSMLGFLVSILLIYANLPEAVDVALGSRSISVDLLSRNAFFYTMIALVVISNGVLLALARAVALIKFQKQPVSTDIAEGNLFRTRISNWLGGFSVILNIFYIIGVFFIGFHNDPQYVAPESYRILVYGSVLLMVGWLVWLPFILLKRNKA